MSFKAIIRRLVQLENDMYGNGVTGCKSAVRSLKSSFNMLKFMFMSILALQVVMISILLVFIKAGP